MSEKLRLPLELSGAPVIWDQDQCIYRPTTLDEDREIMRRYNAYGETAARLEECRRERDEARESARIWQARSRAQDSSIHELQEMVRVVAKQRDELRAELVEVKTNRAPPMIIAAQSVAHDMIVDGLRKERDDLKAALATSQEHFAKQCEGHSYTAGMLNAAVRERDDLKARLEQTEAARKDASDHAAEFGQDVVNVTKELDELKAKLLAPGPWQPRDALEMTLSEARKERDAANAALERMREALERYGEHLPKCPIHQGDAQHGCTCGLSAAIEGREGM